jgi:hypothetical protein
MTLSRQFSFRTIWVEQSHMTALPCLDNENAKARFPNRSGLFIILIINTLRHHQKENHKKDLTKRKTEVNIINITI